MSKQKTFSERLDAIEASLGESSARLTQVARDQALLVASLGESVEALDRRCEAIEGKIAAFWELLGEPLEEEE